MSNFDNIKPRMASSFDTYTIDLLNALDSLISCIDEDDYFNFTYIELILIIKFYKNEFYGYLKGEMEYFWLEDMQYLGPPVSTRKVMFGLTEAQLNDIKIMSEEKRKEKEKVWEDRLKYELNVLSKTNSAFDFELFKFDSELKNVKSARNLDMARSVLNNNIYNIEGWEIFISDLIFGKLSEYKLDKRLKANSLGFSKEFLSDINFSVYVQRKTMLDINYLINNWGVIIFDLRAALTDQTNSSKYRALYPPELAIISQFIQKPKNPSYSKLGDSNSKVRVYANVVSFCYLFEGFSSVLEHALNG